ncbi:MAG: hypothetical protein ACFFB0_08605 [Promethearchaeota archaeon]
MFENVLVYTFFWLPIAFLVGYFFEKMIYHRSKGGYRTMFNVLAIIGVAVHEIAHALLSLITRVPIERIEVNYRDKETRKVSPHGLVAHKRPNKVSFIQSFLIGIAPLLVGVILFFFLLDIACDMSAAPLYRILAGCFCVSLCFGIRPSSQDLKLIGRNFRSNPSKSLFQLILLCSSFGLVWLLVDIFMINLNFEFLYYIMIGIVFMVLKYFCLLWYTIYKHIRRNRQDKKTGVLYGEIMEISTPKYKFSGE